MTGLPDDYIKALTMLAKAFVSYEARTGISAILVGGSATAISTGGAFMSEDFDVVAGDDSNFSEAMAAHGFEEESPAVHGLVAWYHPDFPRYAVEQVSGGYFDGKADRTRCVKLTINDDSAIVLPAVEDLIADRLGQYEVSSGDDAMLEQAKALFQLSDGLDMDYLKRRIAEEGGNLGLLGLA
jgi:hypothetical protein